ncbi:4'-phosphopantetheinyl transferase family protein [Mucilaginibacter sp.]|uniref:4'-phosphopantetheinyl transferase family protein n=1 Tax=Mucilaginibacter sp. TaxID=1882438 RepID=UPI0035BB9FA0
MAGTVHNQDLAAVQWQPATGDVNTIPQSNQVDVWRAQISSNIELIPTLSATFTAGEIVRGSKYYRESDRQRFAVSRGALRFILSRYLNIHPSEIEFSQTGEKKPYIANDDTGLQFNLSHSGDWVLLAIAKQHVGTDIEYLDPDFHFDDIIPEHFSEKEAISINTSDKIANFYKFWTRKEAFLKATGQGLGEHLKVTSALDGYNDLPTELTGHKERWNTLSFNVTEDYTGSVTVKEPDPRFLFWDWRLINPV